MTSVFGVALFCALYVHLGPFAEKKDFVGAQTLRSLARVSLALGQFTAERLTSTDTRLSGCYFFQKTVIQATVYCPFEECLNERVQAVINSLL